MSNLQESDLSLTVTKLGTDTQTMKQWKSLIVPENILG